MLERARRSPRRASMLPAHVRRQRRSRSSASASSSTACPLRGVSVATHKQVAALRAGLRRVDARRRAERSAAARDGRRQARRRGSGRRRRRTRRAARAQSTGSCRSRARRARARCARRSRAAARARVETGLERERMMDKRDDRQTRSPRCRARVRAREREAVDHDDAVGRQRGEFRACVAQRRRRRPRETVVERVHARRPAELARPARICAIVDVAAGRRVRDRRARHRSSRVACLARRPKPLRSVLAARPSYDADATCDSCSVTRMLLDAARRRRRARRACDRRRDPRRRSRRARNSVVVFRP